MGLRDLFKTAAQTAVTAFGDVAVTGTYLSFASATYNASTGTAGPTYSSTDSVKLIINEFRLASATGAPAAPDFDVRVNDKEILIPAVNISGVTPKPKDRVVHDSETWEVVNVFTDPAEALWRLQARRP